MSKTNRTRNAATACEKVAGSSAISMDAAQVAKRQPTVLIGLDPGVNTGVACVHGGKLVQVNCMSAVEAEMQVKRSHEACGDELLVIFEDARLRTWFGSKGREALQGAGSIKRDCQRWEEFLKAHGIQFCAVAPAAGQTKLKAEEFAKRTGWAARTNEHARDAAMLVWPMRGVTGRAAARDGVEA